jgi:hypothetical protein
LDVRDDANRVLSTVLVTMLRDYGNLDFFEVESFVTALFEFGVDKDAAAIAANAALQGHLTHLLSTVGDLGTSEDVQEHAKRLRTIVNEYGSLNKDVVSSIEATIRRIEDRLSQSEEREDDYEGRGSDYPLVEGISNDQIKSLFGQIRSEDR